LWTRGASGRGGGAGALDSAAALGVKPVGAVEAIAGDALPGYLGDAVKGIELVGTIEQPTPRRSRRYNRT